MNTSFKTLLIAAAVAGLAGCGNHGQQASSSAPVMAADGSYKAPNGDTMMGGMDITKNNQEAAAGMKKADDDFAEFNANRVAHGLPAITLNFNGKP